MHRRYEDVGDAGYDRDGGYGGDDGYDRDADYDAPPPSFGGSDRDPEEGERGGDYRDEGGGGRGYARSDARERDTDDAFMPMSRRDVESLYDRALGDMRSFLDDRQTCDPTNKLAGVAIAGVEILVGAGVSAYVVQRFRQAGIPISGTLAAAIVAGLGLTAAQFQMLGTLSPDLRNVMFGVLATAVALWAAGRGIISSEQATAVRTGQVIAFPGGAQAQAQQMPPMPPFAQQMMPPFMPPQQPYGFMPQQAYAPQYASQPQVLVAGPNGQPLVMSAADFNMLLRRAA